MSDGGPYRAVSRNYEHLARVYDDRWRRYNKRTLGVALKALRLSGSERLLDVGCGTGEFERIALDKFQMLRIVGVDMTPAMLAVARAKLAHAKQASFQVALAEALPLPSGVFDAVLSASVLHHTRDPAAVLAECARVLRENGRFVLIDWCRDFLWGGLMCAWLRLTERSCVSIYSLDEVVGIMKEFGLRMRSSGHFLAPPCYGMMWIAAEKTGP